MRFSNPVPVCGIQYQLVQSFGEDLRVCSAGHVQRVGEASPRRLPDAHLAWLLLVTCYGVSVRYVAMSER
ncbi:hypothetical protein NHX12_020998 [Muraenolepis orangiensis]|uniref:Uncharacterized protein n=1 Tax=Muraenolepis orangiensis TaxID=630683 RepID=A0A9Q0EUM8_9TELE|nr:hypothetical protein NHX12_020998 [Muraenolepis orangiensis]